MTARYLLNADRILCCQKQGTGKSCTQVAAALNVLKQYSNLIIMLLWQHHLHLF